MVNNKKSASTEHSSAPQEVSDDELTETEIDEIIGGLELELQVNLTTGSNDKNKRD